MSTHKDLPGGSQKWASDVDAVMEENKQLKEVVKRLCENAGLDFSNPKRGVNVGATPSIKNPVGQKLSSLADVATYDVADKQVLTWNQQGQKWLAATPASGGAIPIPVAYYADSPVTGQGQIDVPGAKWSYYGTTADGVTESWATKTVYMGAGNWSTGPLALVTVTRDGFDRPYVDLYAEDYRDGSTGHLELFNARFNVFLNRGSDYSQLTSDETNLDLSVYGTAASSSMGVEQYCAYIVAPHVVIPQCTTATRPTLHLQDGSMVYDKDLKIPVFYDFILATWRDALGTAV